MERGWRTGRPPSQTSWWWLTATNRDLSRVALNSCFSAPTVAVWRTSAVWVDKGVRWWLMTRSVRCTKGSAVLTFSPDSRRFGYFAESQTDTNLVVLDGKEIAVTDRLLQDSLRFSPDGRRVVYSYGLPPKSRVVLDGQEGPAFDGLSDCFFSPDSQRFAYFAKRGKQWMVVLDGKEVVASGEGRWEGTTVFSPDSRRFATGIGRPGKCCLWVDGREQGEYDEIGEGSVIFSPDSKRLAYGAVRAGRCLSIVDGKEGQAYEAANGLVFSPDSKRVAYWAERDGKRFVVLDGKEGQPYRNIALVTFSPDSRHLAYVAKREDGSVGARGGR